MMHLHDPEPDLAPHVAVSREVEDTSSQGLEAAGAGRPDVLNPGAVLGLQRLAGNAGVDSMLSEDTEPSSAVRNVIGSGGAPLDSSTRMLMESRLGHDFGDVRIHTDAKADESARSVNAVAYTVGTDVVFREGAYQPDSQAGRRTLAHELTHVVQQQAGPVDGTPAAGGIRISDPSDRFEQAAERAADVVSGIGASTTMVSTGPAAAVQRETGSDEDEELQMLGVQRQGDASEEEEEQENPGA